MKQGVVMRFAPVVFTAALICCALCGCSQPVSQSADATPPGARVVHFPHNVSLGLLYVRDWDSSGTWEEKLGPARGHVSVPAGKELRLLVLEPDLKPSVFQQMLEKVGFHFKFNRRLAPDLEPLRHLRPNDLQGISLSMAAINDNDLRYVGRLSGLRDLSLPCGFRWRNPPLPNVTGEGLKHLEGLTNIRHLELDGSGAEDSSLTLFSNYTALEALSVSITDITGTGLAHLAGATHLRTLVLSEEITDEGLRPLLQFPLLEGEFRIPGCKYRDHNADPTGVAYPRRVTDQGLAYLRNLHRVTKLHVTGHIEGYGLENLVELKSLEELSLWFRNLKEKIDISPLKKMTRLRRLSIQYYEVLIPGEVGADLAKALPNCEIEWFAQN